MERRSRTRLRSTVESKGKAARNLAPPSPWAGPRRATPALGQGGVADNIDSIANASVVPTWVPLAVYAGEELVGFVMYGQHPPDTGAWWVIRLMIDRAHQGRGHGRAAMEAVIAMMAERVGCKEIVTSFNPANTAAANLYASLGFQPTGEIEDDEPLLLLRLADRRSDGDR